MSSVFNAEDFMSQTADGAFSTKFETIQEGDYPASIDKIDLHKAQTKDGERLVLDVHWAIDAPAEAERLGRKKIVAKQGIFLDLNESGRLATEKDGKNKNLQLGRLCEAVGQVQDKDWTPRRLEGAIAKVHVKITNQDDGKQFENISSVTKL